MTLLLRSSLRFLPIAAAVTAMSLLVYLAAQQVGRHLANDPQIQIAHDIAAALTAGGPADAIVSGPPTEFARSLATFVTVLDDSGAIVATSGRLHGQPRTVPAGVLASVRSSGEERVTWQPEPGVRLATVVVRTPTGFVVAGRSLRETEARTLQFQHLVLLGWMLTVAGVFALVLGTEFVLSRRSIPK